MPIFCIVGGFTNAHSWRSASERSVSYADWLRARSARLLGPALIFVAFWTILPMLAVALGLISSGMARTGGGEVALPIWFLAVYLLTVAAAPPLLALAVWQCGAMLLLQDAANRWLARPRVWLGVVYANSMVMTFYLWNMTAAVLAAVILLPTGLWPQPETLSTAWWWLRLGWIAACAVCLVPFLFAFRWAERQAAPPPPARRGWIGLATSVAGAIAASGGMAIIADEAFPVQGEAVTEPGLGVVLLAAGALLLRVNPLRPLLRSRQASRA